MALYQSIENIIIRVDDKPTPGTIVTYSGYARPGEIVIDPTVSPPAMYLADVDGNLRLDWAGGGGGGATPGGAPGSLQFNNGGTFGGASGVTTDGTNLTASGSITAVGGVVGNIGNATSSLTANTLVANSANVTTLNVLGESNLGQVGNVYIGGGSNGQFLQTDGAGNLSWSTISSVANANYANFAGDVVNSAQPNITSVGTLTSLNVSGDATVTGNLNISGNLTYIDVTNLRIQDPVIQMGGGANGAPLTTNDGKDRGTYLHVYDTGAGAEIDKFMGWDNSNSEFAFGSNVSVASDVVTFNAFGNIRAGNFIGQLVGNVTGNVSGSAASANSVAGANVVGVVANATYAANSGNAALANVAVVANSVAGANVTGVVANANYASFTGSAASANSVAGANVSGVVANANYAAFSGVAGSANSVAGANVTGVVANANYAGFSGVASSANSVAGSNVVGAVANASYSIVAGSANSVAGANVIGAVANASYSVMADTANSVAGANVSGAVANANYAAYAGDVVNASQSNITSVGTLTGLTVSGVSNLGAVGNVKITGGSNAQVLTTDGAGNLSWSTPSSGSSSFKYTKEFHVDTYNGNDTTGDGSYQKPYKTIMKAHSVMDGSGQALYIHGGLYSEAVTWTRVNADIIGVNDGGISYLQGAWTVSPASSSVRIRNVMWGTTSSLTHDTAGSLYLTQCTFSPVTFSKTGSGYVQLQDCDLGAASSVSVTGAGQFVVDGGMISNVTLNNASALVSTVSCLNVRTVTVTAGVFSSKGSTIYSSGNTANAITASAGTTSYLFETAVYTPSGTPARVSLAGFNSINSSQYDAANSSITGTNLGTITYWDTANVRGNITAGNVNANTNGFAIGYRDVPQVVASNTTMALSDAGKHYYSTTAGNLTLTIPTNANVAFQTGAAITLVVQAAGNILVNAASGVTLYMAGNSTAANRVVGTYGMATLLKVGTDTWFINGTSVT